MCFGANVKVSGLSLAWLVFGAASAAASTPRAMNQIHQEYGHAHRSGDWGRVQELCVEARAAAAPDGVARYVRRLVCLAAIAHDPVGNPKEVLAAASEYESARRVVMALFDFDLNAEILAGRTLEALRVYVEAARVQLSRDTATALVLKAYAEVAATDVRAMPTAPANTIRADLDAVERAIRPAAKED